MDEEAETNEAKDGEGTNGEKKRRAKRKETLRWQVYRQFYGANTKTSDGGVDLSKSNQFVAPIDIPGQPEFNGETRLADAWMTTELAEKRLSADDEYRLSRLVRDRVKPTVKTTVQVSLGF